MIEYPPTEERWPKNRNFVSQTSVLANLHQAQWSEAFGWREKVLRWHKRAEIVPTADWTGTEIKSETSQEDYEDEDYTIQIIDTPSINDTIYGHISNSEGQNALFPVTTNI